MSTPESTPDGIAETLHELRQRLEAIEAWYAAFPARERVTTLPSLRLRIEFDPLQEGARLTWLGRKDLVVSGTDYWLLRHAALCDLDFTLGTMERAFHWTWGLYIQKSEAHSVEMRRLSRLINHLNDGFSRWVGAKVRVLGAPGKNTDHFRSSFGGAEKGFPAYETNLEAVDPWFVPVNEELRIREIHRCQVALDAIRARGLAKGVGVDLVVEHLEATVDRLRAGSLKSRWQETVEDLIRQSAHRDCGPDLGPLLRKELHWICTEFKWHERSTDQAQILCDALQEAAVWARARSWSNEVSLREYFRAALLLYMANCPDLKTERTAAAAKLLEMGDRGTAGGSRPAPAPGDLLLWVDQLQRQDAAPLLELNSPLPEALRRSWRGFLHRP